MDGFQWMGRHVVNEDVRDKVRGRAVFSGDLKLPNMLHGRILRSPFAHARIRSIDKQRAMKVPGVKAVVLGKDHPVRFGHATVTDRPVLAWEKVLYWGEPVAAVAAVDEESAQEALDRIEVEYEPLAAVFDPLEAMDPHAPVLHPELGSYKRMRFIRPVAGTNVCHHALLRTGDPEKGFKEADRIFENSFRVPTIQHCPLEPHIAIAKADGVSRMTLWTSTQTPYGIRSEVCETLGWALSRLRVIVPAVGGAFGGKGSPVVEPIAVILALETGGLPVRLCLDRDEEFISKVRPALACSLKTGVKRDGTLVALETKLYYDNGAYADQGPVVARNSTPSAMGPYRIPHVTVDTYLVYTNNPVSAAFRGFGVPETAWCCESQMDIIAADLGIDPVAFRLKNALDEGSVAPTGEIMRSVGLKECLRQVSTAMAWDSEKPARGQGVAAAFKSGGTPTGSSVLMKVNEDGTASLLTSAVDMGQGLKTVLSQIAAEELGLDPKSIRVSCPDTDVTPYEGSTVACRSTFVVGNSARAAAADARQQILSIAAEILECASEDLAMQGGKIWVKAEPARSLSVAEVWQGGIRSRNQYPIIGRGVYSVAGLVPPPDPSTGRSGRAALFWMYAAQGVELRVSEDTGRIDLIRTVLAHDVGRAVDPIKCEGQIEGSLAMGIGSALTEEMVFQDGRLLNSDWSTYKIPTAMDIPPIIPLLVDALHPDGPYGAKGIAEVGVATVAPAISNAFFNATGVRLFDLPLTPEKVYWALKKRNETRRGPGK